MVWGNSGIKHSAEIHYESSKIVQPGAVLTSSNYDANTTQLLQSLARLEKLNTQHETEKALMVYKSIYSGVYTFEYLRSHTHALVVLSP